MENPENIAAVEHLKLIQAGLDRIKRDLNEVEERLSQLEIGAAVIRGDLAHIFGGVKHSGPPKKP